MPRIDYHPQFVESAVRQVACRDPQKDCDLHLAVDRIYEIPDPETRNCAFEQAFAELFRLFRLDEPIPHLLREFPGVQIDVECVRVVSAARAGSQSAELFGQRPGARECGPKRTIVLQICPEGLADPPSVVPLLRRELLHIEDMLDERFAFGPDDLLGTSPSDRLRTDRYRALWDLYVEARLVRRHASPLPHGDWVRRQLARAFSTVPPSTLEAMAQGIHRAARLTHCDLLRWAQDPHAVPASSLAEATSAPSHPLLPFHGEPVRPGDGVGGGHAAGVGAGP
jgi:hypothetical protein